MMSKIPKQPRYAYIFSVLLKLYQDYGNRIYPLLTPKQLIKENKWIINTYTHLATKSKLKVCEVKNLLSNASGCAIYDTIKKKYKVYYDDTESERRTYFTLAHEMGHIFLGHLEEFEQTQLCRGGLSNKEYEVLEKESDFFARNFLVPVVLVKLLKWNANLIYSFCNLSKPASNVRMQLLKDDIKRLQGLEYLRMNDYLSIPLKQLSGKIKCPSCGYIYNPSDSLYCSMCGNILEKNKIKKERLSMKYPEIETVNGYCKECVRCKNEDINEEGIYCKICGAPVKNICINDDCRTILDGNARYCKFCGAKSSFFYENILNAWDEQESKSQKTVELKSFKEDDLPF